VARLLEDNLADGSDLAPVPQPLPPHVHRRSRVLLAAAVVLAAVGTLLPFSPGSPRPEDAPTTRPTSRVLPLRIRRQLPVPFRCVAFSPAGDLLAAGCDDNTICIYETETQKVRHVLQGHGRPIWSVAFSPDGRTLASAAGDDNHPDGGELKLWDVLTGRELRGPGAGGPINVGTLLPLSPRMTVTQ
jgi:hypothetical protein